MFFKLQNNPIYRISGPDAKRYLQGRITQDISKLEIGQGKASLVLSPQGQIYGKFYVLIEKDDSFLIVSDPLSDSEKKERFISELLKFKVADQLSLEEQDLSLISFQGSGFIEEFKKLSGTDLPEEELSFVKVGDQFFIKNSRSQEGGFDLVCPVDNEPTESFGSEEERTLLRVQAKIPEMGSELNEKIFAPDIPIDSLVSFSKGCYAGQEVVEMAIARGKPNRALTAFSSASQEAHSQGEEIFSGDKKVGFITSSALKDSSCLSLGFLKTGSDTSSLRAGEVELSVL